jgi:hypothetical protein
VLLTFIKLKFVKILYTIVETLPNFIKRKHPRKGKKRQGQKFKQAKIPKKKWQATKRKRNHSKLNLPLVARNISTKERGDKSNKTPTLEEPSIVVTTRLEIATTCTFCSGIDILCL